MSELEIVVAEKIGQIVPEYEKLDVRANIGDKSHSVEFFATINGKKMQCYDMVDDGLIAEKELDVIIKSIAEYIRTSAEYAVGTINKFSFSVIK